MAFDVKVERDAQELADSLGVKIFQADIIYHLFDKFTAYREELKQKKREEFKSIAVFPCKLKVIFIIIMFSYYVFFTFILVSFVINLVFNSFTLFENRYYRSLFSIHVIRLWWAL